MDRALHLKYCRNCINRKFTMQDGIVCGLTGKIADFEETCEHFKEDKSTKLQTEPTTAPAKPQLSFLKIITLIYIAFGIITDIYMYDPKGWNIPLGIFGTWISIGSLVLLVINFFYDIRSNRIRELEIVIYLGLLITFSLPSMLP